MVDKKDNFTLNNAKVEPGTFICQREAARSNSFPIINHFILLPANSSIIIHEGMFIIFWDSKQFTGI